MCHQRLYTKFKWFCGAASQAYSFFVRTFWIRSLQQVCKRVDKNPHNVTRTSLHEAKETMGYGLQTHSFSVRTFEESHFWRYENVPLHKCSIYKSMLQNYRILKIQLWNVTDIVWIQNGMSSRAAASVQQHFDDAIIFHIFAVSWPWQSPAFAPMDIWFQNYLK